MNFLTISIFFCLLIQSLLCTSSSIQNDEQNTSFLSTLSVFNGKLKSLDNDSTLKIDDIVQCEVIKVDMEDDNDSIINVTTTHADDHTYFVAPNEKYFSFKVRADIAVVALSGIPKRSDMIIELVLLSKGKAQFRKGTKQMHHFESLTEVNEPNIIDENSYHGYWIKWTDNGIIEAGRENNTVPFLTCNQPSILPINYIGIHTFRGPGNWMMNFKECPGKNSDKTKYTETRCLQLPTRARLSAALGVKLQLELLEQIEEDYKNFQKPNCQKTKTNLTRMLRQLKLNFQHSQDVHNQILLSDFENYGGVIKSQYLKTKFFVKIQKLYNDFVKSLEAELSTIEMVYIRE